MSVDYEIMDFVSAMYKRNPEVFMEHMADPNIWSGPNAEVHMFVGTVLDPLPRPQDHILCLAPEPDLDKENMKRRIMDVTLVKADVNCKTCLEWMHA